MAVFVSVVAHSAQNDAGNAILGRDLADGGTFHLHAVGGALGLNGGLGLAVAHEEVAGGDLAGQRLDASRLAGGLGGGDQLRVAGVFLQERRVLADHVQLGVVVEHRLADDHIADADLRGHVARDAGEDDLLGPELGDEHLRGGGGVGLAHAGAADHDLLAREGALVIFHAAIGRHGDVLQLGTELIDFIGHCAHNSDNHS